ncbi:HdeD family acid-resistance protein [Sphaerisporangium sp. NPDC051011]|uniref:HdeD family acid-resistance protein n=1 Tax=Sphaerisporangium sp. NPDC051011 TaxID=3155792 RepID=UPI0033D22614
MRDVSGQAAPGMTGRQWWVLAVRGACAIVFGILAIIWPLITLLTLVVLFGIFAIVSGIFTLVGAFRGHHPGGSRTWMIVAGVLSVIAGIIAWIWPGITAFALLMLIAAYAVVIGISEIIAALRRRKAGETEWMWMVTGVLPVIFGILLFVWPAPGALALTWLIGIFAIVYGVSLLVLAYRVHDLGHRGAAGTAAHAM